jgi:hypothetical protein
MVLAFSLLGSLTHPTGYHGALTPSRLGVEFPFPLFVSGCVNYTPWDIAGTLSRLEAVLTIFLYSQEDCDPKWLNLTTETIVSVAVLVIGVVVLIIGVTVTGIAVVVLINTAAPTIITMPVIIINAAVLIITVTETINTNPLLIIGGIVLIIGVRVLINKATVLIISVAMLIISVTETIISVVVSVITVSVIIISVTKTIVLRGLRPPEVRREGAPNPSWDGGAPHLLPARLCRHKTVLLVNY